VTAAFVHTGLVPLVIDLAALTQTAMLVERMFGHITLAGIYLTSAAFAAAIGLSADPLTVHSGAVGAVFGIHGLLVAMLVRGTVQRSPITIPIRRLGGLAIAATVFVAYYMSSNDVQWTAGLATFVIGFALGLGLTRNVAVRKPPARRVLSLATTALTITVAIVAPLSGMTDIRSQVAGLVALEARTTAVYDAAVDQFRTGRLKADGLAQVIDRAIVPELQTGLAQLNAVNGVPPQQQPLIAGANAYLRQRCQSWVIRATALHTGNWRLLRDADLKERASLDALEKLKPAVSGA
jgi:membrane associated rhomboid family serine protease